MKTMTLIDLRDALLEIIPNNVWHFKAFKQSNDYIVWMEDSQSGSVHGDNRMESQVIQGTIHLFTKTEYSPYFNALQKNLNELDLAWRMNSIQYEDETGYIHYEWIFEIENGVGVANG